MKIEEEKEKDFSQEKIVFPKAFLHFLQNNNVGLDVYENNQKLPRYIRSKVKEGSSINKEDLEESLETILESIQVPPNFFRLSGSINISNNIHYKNGNIYGIDLSSGMAVLALELNSNDHCLDLCCAPGAKLLMISDLLNNSGSVTGVDISLSRLNVCRSLLKKYQHNNIRLYNCDGTIFFEPAPNFSEDFFFDQKIKLIEKQTIFFKSKSFLPNSSMGYYDKVLVDAECTHDGSIKHILKYKKWGWDTFERRFLNPERIRSISKLQSELLQQGYELLKNTGILVYSTCSFTVQQNEEIIYNFLASNASAKLLPMNFSVPQVKENINEHYDEISKQIYENTVRFDPIRTQTSGLFIARITKTSHN